MALSLYSPLIRREGRTNLSERLSGKLFVDRGRSVLRDISVPIPGPEVPMVAMVTPVGGLNTLAS
jgi:hypothetical protein